MKRKPMSRKELRWLEGVFRRTNPKAAKQFAMQADAADRRKEKRKGKQR